MKLMKFLPYILLLILIFKPKNKGMKKMYSKDITSAEYIQSQFDKIKHMFNREVLEKIEKVYRLETANFTSGQYRQSLSAGMVYSQGNYILPWNNLSGYNIIGYTDCFMVGDECFRYIQFSELSEGLRFLGNYIERHDGNESRWFSTIPRQQIGYSEKLSGINTRYV